MTLLGLAAGVVMMAGPGVAATKDYAALAKLPDWTTGVWYPGRPRTNPPTPPVRPAPPAYTPAAAAALADYNEKRKQGENLQTEDANCVPPGVPRMMQMPYPIEFLFTPDRVTILTEAYMQVRRIYTDGRPLPEDPDPQFNGNSIGHWEGNTLVVETVGLNTNTTLMTAIHPTENTRIVEHIHETDPGVLVDDVEIIDPALFTQPYKTQIYYTARPDWTIREYVCQENNRDAADPFGRPSMSLGIEGENAK